MPSGILLAQRMEKNSLSRIDIQKCHLQAVEAVEYMLKIHNDRLIKEAPCPTSTE